MPVAELCRELELSRQTFSRWKKKYGGMGTPEIGEPRQVCRIAGQRMRIYNDERPHDGLGPIQSSVLREEHEEIGLPSLEGLTARSQGCIGRYY